MKGLNILESMYQDLESHRTMQYQKATRIINNPDSYDTPKMDLESIINEIADIEKRQSLILFFVKQYDEPTANSEDDDSSEESNSEEKDQEEENDDK